MDITIYVREENLTELNPEGDEVIVNVDLSKVWEIIKDYTTLYMQIVLEITLQNETLVKTQTDLNRTIKVAQIQGQKVQITLPFTKGIVPPIVGKIEILAYNEMPSGQETANG
ncbi:hypothetical protein [Cellulosilyticum ruminicola]|uniref:hypothetical protein n=1 Tax=Cellulosilyticum ruminicola TaxID=425254 RepID=UPI0006D1EEF9|nr:hypothetical protein [Cellulosilyticum ruminicola]